MERMEEGGSRWTSLEMPNKRRMVMRSEDSLRPVIDRKNLLDVIISCGGGAKSYSLSNKFALPGFKVGFARKVFIVLLLQYLMCNLWMALVLTSPSVGEIYADQNGVLYAGLMAYGVIYALMRWTSCAGDGMCFMGYMIITLVMTIALALACGGIVSALPHFLVIGSALWLTLFLITVAQSSSSCLSILTRAIYLVAIFGGVTIGAGMMLWILQYSVNTSSSNDSVLSSIPVSPLDIFSVTAVTPALATMIVYEVKKLVGGRRADLEEQQWVLAALIL